MVAVTPEGVLVAVGWSISVLLWAVLYMKSRRIDSKVSDMWNMKIELKDLNGEVIKVPTRYKTGTDEDGNDVFEQKMVVAPLWYTVMYAAGNLAVQQFQMWFMNQKSNLSKALSKKALGDAAAGEGDLGMLLQVLPAKWQKYIAGAMAVKQLGGQSGGQQTAGGRSGGEK